MIDSHKVRNQIEAACRLSDLFERRRRLTDDWAGYLAGGSRGSDQSVDRPGLRQRSIAFPPGISVDGATPEKGREGGGFWRAPPPPARWRTSAKNPGVAPSTSSPSRAAPRRAKRGCDTPCRHRTGLYPIGFAQSVPTRVQCGFPGTTWTTTARTSPSESGALGWLKGRATSCATYVGHPPFVSGPPLRRHVLDPRRRKSSITSRPLEAGFSCHRLNELLYGGTASVVAFDGGPIGISDGLTTKLSHNFSWSFSNHCPKKPWGGGSVSPASGSLPPQCSPVRRLHPGLGDFRSQI